MAKVIMVQGTMSGVGKSLICAGLLRIFKQDGYKVAPFKSQNMALNSFITEEGLEIGRAQAMQAEAAKIKPSVYMNPILLKPVTNMGSQVIVLGKAIGNMKASEYYAMKHSLIEQIEKAYKILNDEFDIIVIEGAGSPAELNLKKGDFVNMGMAEISQAPVILVGDIDRGGVFAQLYGTVKLLEESEQSKIKGLIVNKFRGDINLFKDGIDILQDITSKNVLGVVPMMDIEIDDEDSMSERLKKKEHSELLDIVVIYLNKISNFTDFMPLSVIDGVGVRYVKEKEEIGHPDLIIIPGSKNTISDLKEIRENGIEARIKQLSSEGTPIIGICGGFQMLGMEIIDEDKVEGGGSIRGIGLLPVKTVFSKEKETSQQTARIEGAKGIFSSLNGQKVSGYEIHMGESTYLEDACAFMITKDGKLDGCSKNNTYGTYMHGFFDEVGVRECIIKELCDKKGISNIKSGFDYVEYKEKQYDYLAEQLRKHLDINKIYEILNVGLGDINV